MDGFLGEGSDPAGGGKFALGAVADLGKCSLPRAVAEMGRKEGKECIFRSGISHGYLFGLSGVPVKGSKRDTSAPSSMYMWSR